MILPFYFFFSFFSLTTRITAQKNKGVQELYRFPKGTGISHVLVLRNESLLLTLFTEPSLYRLDPKASKPVLVHRFPGRTSLFGIAQVNQDQIALIAGNLVNSEGSVEIFSNEPGSSSVFLLSLSGRILKSFPVPEAGALISITTLPKTPQYILLSDGGLAVIWRLNIRTGAVDQTITTNNLLSADERKPLLNGIHVQNDYLYFTDAGYTGIGRLRITPDGRPAVDFPETQYLSRYLYDYYDFAIRLDRSIYFTNVYDNTVNYLTPFEPYPASIGIYEVLTSKEGLVHPTGIAFSDNAPRCNIMYVVTAGNQPDLDNRSELGEKDIGGQVLKVDLSNVGSFSKYVAYNTSCKA